MKNPSVSREWLGLKTIHPPEPVLPRVIASRNGRESESKVALYVCLFGDFQVWRDGALITPEEWRTQKEKTLMKILLTERSHVVLQDRLIELLWPRLSVPAALNRLWVSVNYLRHALEPHLEKPSRSHFIVSRPHGYLFDAAGLCKVDADEFTAHRKAGDSFKEKREFDLATEAYVAAEALYAGDYLEEDLYEEWAMVRRGELQQAYVETLESLAECLVQRGRYHQALTWYQRILAREQCREAIWRQVMLCYWRLRERDQALKAFEQCRDILRKELSIPPMRETLELRRCIVEEAIQSGELSKI